MQIRLIKAFLTAVSVVCPLAANAVLAEDSGLQPHLLLSYFTGNGEDGLHLAHSRDGYVWRALKGGQWFVYFDKYRKHRYGLVVSRDLANWTDQSEKLRMPEKASGTAPCFAYQRRLPVASWTWIEDAAQIGQLKGAIPSRGQKKREER